MATLRQQLNTPEQQVLSKISQLQKQRLFKRRATEEKSASWKGKEINICGKSS